MYIREVKHMLKYAIDYVKTYKKGEISREEKSTSTDLIFLPVLSTSRQFSLQGLAQVE